MESELKQQLNMTENPTVEEAAASPCPPWTELPSELTAIILQRLGALEMLETAQNVCVTWWKICQNPDMWREMKIIVNPNDHKVHTTEKMSMMCRRAVDRSQGQLIDLTIARLFLDTLLDYIVVVNGSRQLRSLTLATCFSVSLTTQVKKLTQLEELHFHHIDQICAQDIEAIGVSLPMLKSFTFNHPWLHLSSEKNAYALAIANSMPNLHNLGLIANPLDNECLEAILDGCPHLESLDLRRCRKVDLGGALGVRCRDRIKDLRLPTDSLDDYEWRINVISCSDYDSDSDYDDNGTYENYEDFMFPRMLVRKFYS